MGQEGFIGEIRMFGGNFAPRTWALCEGQLLAISSNTALFSILGTTYGGDGRTSFALPDLRGRAAMGNKNGPGLTPRQLGQKSGQEVVQLNLLQIPSHNHASAVTVKVGTNTDPANLTDGAGHVLASAGANVYNAEAAEDGEDLGGVTATSEVGFTGGSQVHNNLQPYQVVNYIIALQGTYPSRS